MNLIDLLIISVYGAEYRASFSITCWSATYDG